METQKGQLSLETISYLDKFFDEYPRDQQNGYPVRVAEVHLLPISEVLTNGLINSTHQGNLILDHPNYAGRFSSKPLIEKEELTELMQACSKDYTTNLFGRKNVHNYIIDNFQWKDLNVSTRALATQDEFVFDNGRAYPVALNVESSARARLELEKIIPQIQSSVEGLKGKTFPYIFWNKNKEQTKGLGSALREIRFSGNWIYGVHPDIEYLENKARIEQDRILFKRDITIGAHGGRTNFGSLDLEFILPDGTSLTKQKISQYHSQKSDVGFDFTEHRRY